MASSTRRRKPQPEERPDPLIRLVTPSSKPVTEPEASRLEKTPHTPHAATGSPAAGRSTIREALHGGPTGLLHLLGPGLITGASDDDPSGIGTYSQAGSQFGFGLLWMSLFTFPLMVAVQEACSRIALHTGVGLGTSLRRKFPNWLVGACILALLVANTINIGADFGAVAGGGSLLTGGRIPATYLVVPVAALLLLLQLRLPYAIIFRMFKFLTLALFAYVITAVVVHPPLLKTIQSAVVPHLELNTAFIAMVVAILGTTISPYLFFWQASSEVDEMRVAGGSTEKERRGVSTRELAAARTDVAIGMAFSQIVMFSIILTSAVVLNGAGHTNVQSAQQAAHALSPLAGRFAFALFSIGIIGTGLLAIPVLAGSAAYAVKEFLGIRGTLVDKPRYRPTFYSVLALAMAGGVVMNLLHMNPLQALVIAAVINGLVAPPIMVLIALLAGDRKVMRNRRSGWLSRGLVWTATAVMSVAAVALLISIVHV